MLKKLQISDFRCIRSAELDFDQRCTLIVGPNGSGKTSILEAAHVLSCGRSFRAAHIDQVVRAGASSFTTVGWVAVGERESVLGVSGNNGRKVGGVEARISGNQVQGFAELAAVLPLQIIDPNLHRLLEDGPELRRRFLDRGLFHVEQSYIQAWRRYQRALRQRNQALRLNQGITIVRAWDRELIAWGTAIDSARQDYVNELQNYLADTALRLLDFPIEISLKSGWSNEKLDLALEQAWERDLRMRATTIGPHRADLSLRITGRAARHHVSRGQQKLLVAALILAQIEHWSWRHGRRACLLLDDPSAELDVDNLSKLLAEMERTTAQLIVTGLDKNRLIERFQARVFHVKQGQVHRLI